MAGTQLVKMGTSPKTSINISSAVRQASCSRGWLRIVVQYFFGIVTVASFVMIVLISMRTPKTPETPRTSSCEMHACRIQCNYTPTLYGDVSNIVSESEVLCPKLSLVLKYQIFENEMLPSHWFSPLRGSINTLAIIRGNLKYIAPQAFMSLFAGNIEVIVFDGITLANWMPESFVGLSSLRQLFIKNCNLINVQNFLRSVDDTLDLLTISQSGSWDPANITGLAEMSKLETVDFSFNIFNDVLSNESFIGLANCKILYLNSCNITSLGLGTFDHFQKIEVIYLNQNLLVTLPTGLFNGLLNHMNPKLQINLQDNPWHCDCSSCDLLALHYNELLYVDPTCNSPEQLRGKPFSEISKFCDNDSYADVVVVDVVELSKATASTVSTRFFSDCTSETSGGGELVAPNNFYRCDNLTLSPSTANTLFRRRIGKYITDITKSDWITPTYLVRHDSYSMVQVSTLSADGYGLMWFKINCPNQMFCMSSLPKFLRIYDHYVGSQYTFCPIDLNHGFVRVDKCVDYNSVTLKPKTVVDIFGNVVLYIATVMLCLTIGAVLVYAVIRCNPILLKGSKRLLFVKHKNVDALVLPPKVPLRTTLSDADPDPIFNVTKTCIVPENENNLSPRSFVRMKSTRSDMSTVSYISALQPTEDQLAEWRIKTHFDNNITMTTDREMSIFSWNNDGSNSSEYVSTSSVTYESLK